MKIRSDWSRNFSSVSNKSAKRVFVISKQDIVTVIFAESFLVLMCENMSMIIRGAIPQSC